MTTNKNALRLSPVIKWVWIIRSRHHRGHVVQTCHLGRDLAVRAYLRRHAESQDSGKPAPRMYRLTIAAVEEDEPTVAEWRADMDVRFGPRLGNDVVACKNRDDAHGVEPASRDSLGEPVAGPLDT